MGGKGSGRTPLPRDDAEQVVAATGTATGIAQGLPTRREKDAARKREERAKAKVEGPKKRYPKPEDFRGHPLAKALNSFADKTAGLAPPAKGEQGAAEQCGLGEAWMAVVDYYMVGPDHPAVLAVIATAQFGAVAWAMKREQGASVKGPNSPAGTTPPAVMDPVCFHCGQTFPDQALLQGHLQAAHL